MEEASPGRLDEQGAAPVSNKKTIDHLDDIRQQIEAQDPALGAARTRRDDTRHAGACFPGALRTFSSGSLATGFVNHPVDDADAGVVLDRRHFPELGPDGEGELPYDIVDKVHDHIRDPLRDIYPKLRIEKMKRGLLIKPNEPIDAEQDPTVDLVIALNRAADDALWIPNLDKEVWEPSHPEKHVELFTEGSPELRRTRAWTTRIGKAWNKQWSDPALCSFNIAALVREAITTPMPLDRAVATFFEHSANAIADGPTADPAGVSDPIRLPLGRDVAVKRLTAGADGLRDALAGDDDPERVADALSRVFPDFIEAPLGSKAATAATARTGLLVPATAPAAFRGTRSYGAR
jgi:hypothetical protein